MSSDELTAALFRSRCVYCLRECGETEDYHQECFVEFYNWNDVHSLFLMLKKSLSRFIRDEVIRKYRISQMNAVVEAIQARYARFFDERGLDGYIVEVNFDTETNKVVVSIIQTGPKPVDSIFVNVKFT